MVVTYSIVIGYDFLIKYISPAILFAATCVLIVLVIGLMFEFRDECLLQLEQARYQATHDFLTGVPNKSLFYDRLQHAFKAARRKDELIAVVFVDLDDFKTINDLHGHLAGDELVQEVAKRLKKITRAVDTVARFGGDEFALVLEDIKDKDTVTMIANKIHSIFDNLFYISEPYLPISVVGSVGVAVLSEDLVSPEDMVECADQAMYKAKKSTNKVCIQTKKSIEVFNVK